ncbi:MAG TPA: DoxX family protein [Asanoa sp.]|nr:DoxX family protein [Asanoa sp.]
MSIVLWIAQAVLAALFAMSGLSKLVQQKDKLAEKYTWMADFSAPMVRVIGALEVAGGIGLVVPPLAAPAATGLAVMMLLAAGLHVRRRETRAVVITAVLVALTALVAWGRFGPYGS